MIKQPKIQKVDNSKPLQGMVEAYNDMYADPLAYAKSKYAAQIKDLGRPYGGDRDARYKTVIPQSKDKIPN